jgi:hypothetical protein
MPATGFGYDATMIGYRARVAKPTVALWLLVVVADAGAAITSSNGALLGAVVVIGVLTLAVLGAYAVFAGSHTWRTANHPVRNQKYSFK